MMDTIYDSDVTTIPQALEAMLSFAHQGATTGVDPYLWFRGVKSDDYKLQSGVQWRAGYNEKKTLIEFTQRGAHFHDSDELGNWNSWSTYYLAQHYGIPTRLLDWSESFASALFFAFDGAEVGSSPCVWVLDPGDLNRATCGYEGIISPENNEEIDIWLPDKIGTRQTVVSTTDSSVTYDNALPLAIFPKQGNARIRSQSGFFTVSGSLPDGLETVIESKCAKPKETLLRIRFRGADVARLKQDLGILGIRRGAIYPDLAGFVGELKELYKW